MNIFICAAHPDDEVIGAGGTIAKLSEKHDIYSIIFSYGDKFPFWEKKEKVVEKRKKEVKICQKIIGIKKTIFLGYGDLEIKNKKEEAVKKLTKLLIHYKPKMVFTHTNTDGHPDHRAVYEITKEAIKKSLIKTKLLTFGINFFNFKKGVKVIYDITDTFGKKMQAINAIKSQHKIMILLKPLILLKAILFGLKINKKFGECFVMEEL